MPWFRVDDKLHDHRKTRVAKKAAMGVWVLAGSWAMDHLTDGFVPVSVLSRWGTRKDAETLVDAELWEPGEQDGEKGWRFRNWSEFQPSKAEVEAERAATRERVKKWRENNRRNGVTPDVTNDTGTGDVRSPRPDPTRPDPSMARSGRHLTSVPGGLSDDDLTKIADATGGDTRHATRVAADILGRCVTAPRSPLAYVLRSVGDEPARYRPTTRPPKRSEECPTHPGQWATACNGCAADAKAGDV